MRSTRKTRRNSFLGNTACVLLVALVLPFTAQAEMGDSYVHKGNEYYHEQQWDKAIEQYQLAIKINPEHLGALHNLGIAYQSKRDFAKAITTFQKIKKLDKLYVPAYISMGLIYAQKGLYKKAQAEYVRAVILEPDNLVAHLNLSAILAKQGFYVKALRAARRGLAIAPASPHLHLLIANVYFIKQKYALAKLEYLKALKLQPETPGARMMLALSMAHLGQFEGALTQMDIVKSLDIHPVEIARNKGKILALRFYKEKVGWKEAVDALKFAASQSGDDPEIYKELGDLMRAMSQVSEARKWYKRVLAGKTSSIADKTKVETIMKSWPKSEKRANVSSKL